VSKKGGEKSPQIPQIAGEKRGGGRKKRGEKGSAPEKKKQTYRKRGKSHLNSPEKGGKHTQDFGTWKGSPSKREGKKTTRRTAPSRFTLEKKKS